MEEYGFLYNKFNKDVKKFSNKPNYSQHKNNYSIYLGIICVIIFFIITKYCI